jgi:hypothetical protein
MSIRALAISATLALAACSPPQQQASTAPNGKPGDAPAAAQTPAPTPVADTSKPDASAAVQSANPITPQFLVGRWGDNGDCSKDVVFNADGTFHSYTGLDGRWEVNGDTIVMSGARGAFTLQMQYIDQSHLMLRNPDGSIGTSQRC